MAFTYLPGVDSPLRRLVDVERLTFPCIEGGRIIANATEWIQAAISKELAQRENRA
jgi:hypothetical protein